MDVTRAADLLSRWHADDESLDRDEAALLASFLIAHGPSADEPTRFTGIEFLVSRVHGNRLAREELRPFLEAVLDAAESVPIEVTARGYLLTIFGDSQQLNRLTEIAKRNLWADGGEAKVYLLEAKLKGVSGAREAVEDLLSDATLDEEVREFLVHGPISGFQK